MHTPNAKSVDGNVFLFFIVHSVHKCLSTISKYYSMLCLTHKAVLYKHRYKKQLYCKVYKIYTYKLH